MPIRNILGETVKEKRDKRIDLYTTSLRTYANDRCRMIVTRVWKSRRENYLVGDDRETDRELVSDVG